MIDVIVSNTCPHCDTQVEAMQKSFFNDEYRIINIASQEFNTYESKTMIDAVPFIIVKDRAGSVKYAASGVVDGTELRKIDRDTSPAFNLRKARVTG